ncbi:hypothetical protein [Roseospira visakhapatnamensis]|uniref:Putative ABC-type ATPase n=1 Tax=Roseospira visakhapatnamensis TaxID=390880 RepID=A0A7W6WBN3_9PROT|nr:hypothetical protein [Roseospira visakhapatnamensis]MBB4268204.1 putative ABC-type ATPase [Roseospira visakhapatnamensis]
MTRPRPQLWVFAGPNGAGKSTLVTRYKVAVPKKTRQPRRDLGMAW